MKLERVIAVRNNKTIYRDGDRCVKVFDDHYSKADVLNVRKGAGPLYAKVKFSKRTRSAQEKILKLAGKKVDGYVKGLTFTVSKETKMYGKVQNQMPSIIFEKLLKGDSQ